MRGRVFADQRGDIFADPDVSKASWVAVELEVDRQLVGVLFVLGRLGVAGRALQFKMVVSGDAVVQHGDETGCRDLAIVGETRGSKQDVVSLPFTRLAADIHGRWLLLVDRAALAIKVRFVVV